MKRHWNIIMILICILSVITISLFGYAMFQKKQVEESGKRIFEAEVWSDQDSSEGLVEIEDYDTKPDMNEQKSIEQESPEESPKTAEHEKKKKHVKKNAKKKIAIDAGHQLQGDNGMEPIGPGATEKKIKVSSGTSGVSTGVPEYELNLTIAKKLEKELKKRGYQVYIIRSKNNITLSNVERAKLANDSGSDIYIRLHADGVENVSTHGASALYPSKDNPYVGNLSAASKRLSEKILNSYCETTGFTNRGLSIRNDLTGTNWSKIPVTLLEMGFMSNPAEDEKMQQESMQKLMVEGIADGVDAYFREE